MDILVRFGTIQHSNFLYYTMDMVAFIATQARWGMALFVANINPSPNEVPSLCFESQFGECQKILYKVVSHLNFAAVCSLYSFVTNLP